MKKFDILSDSIQQYNYLFPNEELRLRALIINKEVQRRY